MRNAKKLPRARAQVQTLGSFLFRYCLYTDLFVTSTGPFGSSLTIDAGKQLTAVDHLYVGTSGTGTLTVVPEPSTLILAALGLLGAAFLCRRRRKP